MAMITLATDYGTEDGYVGALKGKILKLNPLSYIYDITHRLPAHDIAYASIVLERSTLTFPRHTIHMAIVDPLTGTDRDFICVRASEGIFLAPDNGILTRVLPHLTNCSYWKLRNDGKVLRRRVFDASALLAPVAALLSNDMDLIEVAEPCESIKLLDLPTATFSDDGQQITGQILGFDHFGNALVNISVDMLPECEWEALQVDCGGTSFSYQEGYYEQKQQDHIKPVAVFNHDNMLELAVFERSAKQTFALATNMQVTVTLPE